VTRRRSRAAGRHRPGRPRSLLTLLPLALLLVAACGDTSATGTPSANDAGSTSPGTPTAAASAAIPTDEPSDAASDDPTVEPSEASDAPSIGPSPSGGGGSAAACTGNDGNRDFYASIAEAVDWPVYCAVLPARWFVDSGEYSLRRGGRLDIAYRGPGGARLHLQEGAFCGDTTGCLPPGAEAGSAAFGDMEGTLVRVDDGSFAIVVGDAAPLAWVARISGVDEATAREIGGALTLVG
jgi:hypothetical protein